MVKTKHFSVSGISSCMISVLLTEYCHSASPSPSNARLQGDRGNGAPSRYSAFSSASHGRPSLITSLSNDGSDTQSKRSQPYSFADDHWNRDRTRQANGKMGVAERAFAWRERGRATAMLRTASDGADVVLEEGGMEWEVVEPHGTGRGRQGQDAKITRRLVARIDSWGD